LKEVAVLLFTQFKTTDDVDVTLEVVKAVGLGQVALCTSNVCSKSCTWHTTI
jgi:hypothetical protein